MKISESIKVARQNAFLTQEEFAKELNVSACTVNRWEMGKARPNNNAMKNIKLFCESNGIDFEEIKTAWISSTEDQ